MIRRVGFVVALAVMLLPSGFAQEDDLDSMREKAEQGDPESQHDLGFRFWFEHLARELGGVPEEPSGFDEYGNHELAEEALKWFRKAAEQGYAPAEHNLGLMYDKGQGVPQDYQEALKWYRKAAEQGHAPGQFCLGLMYDEGQGVPQDYQEALKWYRKAAEQGDARAQNNLGVMYRLGQGVPKDYVRAHMWLNLAASKLSGEERDDTVKLRDRLAEKMTREQIAEAQKLAREWKPKGEKAGE